GKMEEAKLYYYKALFHDPNCGNALYELAKLYESGNDNVNAVNFFDRAAQELNKVGDPISKVKAKDCEKHILKLSPYTTEFNTMMEAYAQDLGKITAKATDSITQEEAQNKIMALNLTQIV